MKRLEETQSEDARIQMDRARQIIAPDDFIKVRLNRFEIKNSVDSTLFAAWKR